MKKMLFESGSYYTAHNKYQKLKKYAHMVESLRRANNPKNDAVIDVTLKMVGAIMEATVPSELLGSTIKGALREGKQLLNKWGIDFNDDTEGGDLFQKLEMLGAALIKNYKNDEISEGARRSALTQAQTVFSARLAPFMAKKTNDYLRNKHFTREEAEQFYQEIMSRVISLVGEFDNVKNDSFQGYVFSTPVLSSLLRNTYKTMKPIHNKWDKMHAPYKPGVTVYHQGAAFKRTKVPMPEKDYDLAPDNAASLDAGYWEEVLADNQRQQKSITDDNFNGTDNFNADDQNSDAYLGDPEFNDTADSRHDDIIDPDIIAPDSKTGSSDLSDTDEMVFKTLSAMYRDGKINEDKRDMLLDILGNEEERDQLASELASIPNTAEWGSRAPEWAQVNKKLQAVPSTKQTALFHENLKRAIEGKEPAGPSGVKPERDLYKLGDASIKRNNISDAAVDKYKLTDYWAKNSIGQTKNATKVDTGESVWHRGIVYKRTPTEFENPTDSKIPPNEHPSNTEGNLYWQPIRKQSEQS